MSAASDKENEIFSLILLGDDLAFAMLCDLYYEPVLKKVLTFNKGMALGDEALIMDTVTDSFLNFFKNPQRYNPEKQNLEGFLVMDIIGDLKNAVEKLKRQNKKIQKPVGLYDKNGNDKIEDLDLIPVENLISRESALILEKKLEALFADEKDRQVAHLILAGERRSTEYARLLEIEHLDKQEQNLEIKRCKDRIDKTIKRKFRI